MFMATAIDLPQFSEYNNIAYVALIIKINSDNVYSYTLIKCEIIW